MWTAPEAPRSESTGVRAARGALSREEALRHLAGRDPRPLLVLRECVVCNKTDDALLSKTESNEKTLIFSRWFHCVKLPVDVIEPSHPFNALFPSNDTEHLFVSAVDGSGKVPLESDTSQTELWAAMTKVLANAYAADPNSTYREIVRHLDLIDVLDGKARDLGLRQSALMETPKVDVAKVKKLEAEVADLKRQIAAERAEIDRCSKLDFKPVAPANAGASKVVR